MPQLPSVSELIGSARVDSAAGTTVQTYSNTTSYTDFNDRKNSTTSVSSTTNEGSRRLSTDQSRHHRLPSISDTILNTSSKRNSIDTSPRSSAHLPSLPYSLSARDQNINNSNTSLGSSPPRSRRLTETAFNSATENTPIPLTLPRTSSGNYLPNHAFKFQLQQPDGAIRSSNVRPQVGSPIGSADKLHPSHMYVSSPITLHKEPPHSLPPLLHQLPSHTQSISNTVSPTHNPPTLEIAADSINATTVPQHINVQPTGPPTHVNHGFQISKSAPTTTTNTTSSYPRYHYQTAPRSGSTSSQAGPPPPEHYFVAYPQQQLQQQQLQQQQQQQQQLQQLQQQASMPIQTSPPPPPSASIQNHNQVVAGPGYYIVQHPQLIPLPPTAPHLQGQTYHSLPAHPLHNQAPLFQPQQGFHEQMHYDPHRVPHAPSIVVGPPPPPTMYAYNMPYSDENNALVNKRKIIKRRTRTGCLTCRKRRIKCDERKPSCFNCERLKKVCLGYENLSNLQPRKRVRDTSLDLPSADGGVGIASNQLLQNLQQQVYEERGRNGL